MTALLLALPAIVLAGVSVALALKSLRLANRAAWLAGRALEVARGPQSDGLVVPFMTDAQAAGALRAWDAKKAEALGREVDDALKARPWVYRPGGKP